MRIFIMRHGEAETMAKIDADRNLTAHGIQQAKEQGEWLTEAANHIDRVIVSPYNRALQTYEHLAASTATNMPSEIETWEAVTPYGNSTMAVDYLSNLCRDGVKNVLIVSHLPFVEDLVTALCESPQQVGFSTGTIAEIEWQGEQGEFICSNRPEV
ncbi:phosphohistidine phosphatase SixA [Testudinibacter sp. TR-2022]|uniref:phosphohistidine phosphatase SixA n=1 Tax=Testudinibacter sp. TR-2022 TaxID=2585029 RepID=UPI001117D940|nr:phosphohistidine phosphatase SixA [Testudinibacter sp. TR-2022]TNH03852.1 phosphohistidine phosphatase SixA [Pasteurellaceae bacterium Phil31]TNH06750.1 phosphohistidine phosphatase SixA [Pasteurellaceae bacterium Phil11]TNH10455.1 phosphohistidine phosphatase SixA [Testudinibacter sp. TR-2022]TNH10681.1 phosphohistidine phosphatase SixA [Testudinibacter sp. TR-2022]TNH11355.1 phosphohistidine phosphatase SixA [Testudinibacter sp. TR-2022]